MLIDQDKSEYKCFDTLKNLLDQNEDFQNVVTDGFLNGEITGFSEELWNKLDKQNIRARGVNSFLEVFRDGANIGYCTVCAKQVSYSLDHCYICGGVLPILIGTANCVDGSHTWIESDDKIIDTTLMLVMDKKYAQKIGYIEENRYNPNLDPIYSATKDFTLDSNFRKKI